MHTPFYDPTQSYEDNYANGPFGAFAADEVSKQPPFQEHGKPSHDYFGELIYLPFGIPAGPLLNSHFVAAAFALNFDVCVYKTVRSSAFPCHPFPNVLGVQVQGDLTLDSLQQPIIATNEYTEPLSITNSFGVPSRPPQEWQPDAQRAIAAAGPGQVLVLSFMGTVRPNQTPREFVDDFVLAAKLAKETGAKVLEANLSCPNIGNEGLVCYNLDATADIARALRQEIGDTPLVLKVGYYADDAQLEKLAKIVEQYADGVAAINTLSATVVDQAGKQALPGPNRAKSGVCGDGIRWAGLEMVQRLHALREQHGYHFRIEGVGGVTKPSDYHTYRTAGADSVMSATGAMWNPFLAREIKQSVKTKDVA